MKNNKIPNDGGDLAVECTVLYSRGPQIWSQWKPSVNFLVALLIAYWQFAVRSDAVSGCPNKEVVWFKYLRESEAVVRAVV